MDNLPPHLIVDILSRLTDSIDLARCRPVSKTFNSASREVRSINLLCTLSRYLKSRSPETRALTTPFKTVFNNLVNNCYFLEHVSIGVEKNLRGMSYDEFDDESDDLYLTDVGFVKEWLPRVSGELKSISISDFWIQSCWRKSEILAFISSCCHALYKLEVKNAWLSVDGLNPMPMLTSLTLEFIRLEDEDLKRVNKCFPGLQVLNLMGVGGLKEPKIDLIHLKTCQWTVSNAPNSLTIVAPNLVKLMLKCIRPRSLLLETPLLTDFYLSLELPCNMDVKMLLDLKTLHLESANLGCLVYSFPPKSPVKRLTVDTIRCIAPLEMTRLGLGLDGLLDAFPNVSSLTLRSGAWSEMEAHFLSTGLQNYFGMKGLKELVVHLVIHDIDFTLMFILSVLDECSNLSDVSLFIHCDVDPDVASQLISRCRAYCSRVRWRWGIWKEDADDIWVSDSI